MAVKVIARIVLCLHHHSETFALTIIDSHPNLLLFDQRFLFRGRFIRFSKNGKERAKYRQEIETTQKNIDLFTTATKNSIHFFII
jgi:hypothetical protein